jgi:hypothetical protein
MLTTARLPQDPTLKYVHPALYYYYYYSSTALCWALAAFSVSWSYTQPVGRLGWGISPSQGLYLHSEQHKYRINAHNTDIHALSGIRTRDRRVLTSEDSSCLRPRGHCDQHPVHYTTLFIQEQLLTFSLNLRLGFPSSISNSRFPTKSLHEFLVSSIRPRFYSQFSPFDLIT